MKIRALVLSLFCSYSVLCQMKLEISHSWAGNLTTARTTKTENRTRGYQMSPCFVSHHHNIGVGLIFSKKNKLVSSFQIGALSTGYKVHAYAKKYPELSSPVDEKNQPVNYISTNTGSISSKQSIGLVKVSLTYENIVYSSGNFENSLGFGVGFIKKRDEGPFLGLNKNKEVYHVENGNPVVLASHSFIVDEYINNRNFNVFLSLGYEFSYRFAKRWQVNVGVLYHQGLFKMVSWHSYREFKEPLIGYKEFDEQWTYTRLSHFELNLGVTFQIDLKVKKGQ